MIIRPYKSADFQRLDEIDHQVFTRDLAYSHLELQYYLRSRKCRSLVAEEDSVIVGFVIAEFEPPNIGHIITIDVARDRQRHHIGSTLLDGVERWLWEREAEAIYLETPVDDTGAFGFYEKHGYFIFERIEGYYNGSLDAFVMMKTSRRPWKGPERSATFDANNQ
ncbi:MAG: GNAT family N-acetyltransferase [Blastocatellia bacterium]